MVRAEAPNDGPGLTDASVGFKCWPDSDAPSLRLSFLLLKIFYIFHLSVCLRDSPSEYLTLEGGTKPSDAPRLSLLSEAHTLCFPLRLLFTAGTLLKSEAPISDRHQKMNLK